MPIDPSIILGLKPVQVDTPGIVNMIQQGRNQALATAQHQQQMAIGQQQLESGRLSLEEHQRQASEGDKLRALFAENPDIRTALPKVFAINPTVGMAMQKNLHETEKADLDNEKAKIETRAKKAERFGAIANTITDESSLHQGVATALNEGLVDAPTAQQILSQGWNPRTQAQVAQIAQGGMNVEQQKKAALDALENQRKALAAQHEAEMRPYQLDEAQIKAATANRQQDARLLAVAAEQGPEALSMAFARLQRAGAARLAPFQDITPQTKPEDILRRGMTANEVTTADSATATASRQEAAEKERERHNRAIEEHAINAAADHGTSMMVPNPNGGFTLQRIAPGQAVPDGAVSPSGMSTLNVPTANTRAMSEKAPRVVQFVDRINQLLDENEKALGPLGSRWNEFTAGKVGLPNKGYTQLRTDAGLLQTALMQMHVGSRGSVQIMEHFKELIDTSKQSPENLRAALAEIRTYAEQVAKEGGSKGAPSPKTTSGAPQVGTVIDGHRFKGGDPNKQENWVEVVKR